MATAAWLNLQRLLVWALIVRKIPTKTKAQLLACFVWQPLINAV